jgi:hypothetical protein
VSADYERLQLQEGPHVQASPHAQAAFGGSAFGVWHPNWQDAPGHDLQEHWVELDMVCFPFDLLACCQRNEFDIEALAGY